MAITYNMEAEVFSLSTRKSEYQIKVGRYGFLLHSYYGAPVGGEDMSYLIGYTDCGFSGNPAEAKSDRTFSLDTLPLEYPVYGIGDFRDACLELCFADGSRSADFRYSSHIIYSGKYSLKGLPSMYGSENEWQTLEIALNEIASDITLTLYYAVCEKHNIITRACKIKNNSSSTIKLERIMSYCVDFLHDRFDLITFCGRHAFEREPARAPLRHGFQSAQSIRGASSHQYNPFGILCEHNADENQGECYGFHLLYSGNFLLEVERTQRNCTRIIGGIHPQGFEFVIKNGESVTAPEAALTYSANGFDELSYNYHEAFRTKLCRTPDKWQRRPVVLNNWEATYFNFNEKKLLELAKSAADLGVDMLVLDDGWFGNRNSDDAGLGDWEVNTQKLANGLPSLVQKINELGLKFGIWVEPEMVNENSLLYRAHPDWALKVPGREPCRARDQLVLDFSRSEVRNYIYNAISKVIKSANIEYIKWDMNRHLTNVFSASLAAERQGETTHRYMLGVYEFLERLHSDFPELLIEGCSGGGGRFDAGMLYYTPQIWCSDNTDPIQRLTIQYGTSFGYPTSSISAHVSASPNHQTGRSTPLNTRGTAAMIGCFGLELNPLLLTYGEKEQLRALIKKYKVHEELITQGRYHRLTTCEEKNGFAAWQFTSKDKSEALVNVVATTTFGNAPFNTLRLAGLDENAIYIDEGGRWHSGAALCNGGILIPQLNGDYPVFSIYFNKIQGE